MTDFTTQTPESPPSYKKSRPSRLVPVLIIGVLAFAAIIGLFVIDPWNHGDSQPVLTPPVVTPAPGPDPFPDTRPVTTVIKPWRPDSPDSVKPPVEASGGPAAAPEPSSDQPDISTQIRYVGRADYHAYHRLTCKYARRIVPDNLVAFRTAVAARAAGYIPCKVCNPPEDDSQPQEVATLPLPTPKPPEPAPEPVPEPTPVPMPPPVRVKPQPAPAPEPPGVPAKPVVFQLAPIDYHYDVTKRDLSRDQGFIRVDYYVDVDRPLKRAEAINLAKKLVSEETAKNAVNAVAFVIQRKTSGPKDAKWIIWIDWAPKGNMTSAGDVPPGEYATHQFFVVVEGTL